MVGNDDSLRHKHEAGYRWEERGGEWCCQKKQEREQRGVLKEHASRMSAGGSEAVKLTVRLNLKKSHDRERYYLPEECRGYRYEFDQEDRKRQATD